MLHLLPQCFRSFKIRALFGIGRGASQVVFNKHVQYLKFLSRQTRPGATSPHGTGIADCIVCFICIAPNISTYSSISTCGLHGGPSCTCGADLGQHMSFDLVIPFPQSKWGVHLSTTLWGSVIEHHDTPTTSLTATPSCETRFAGNSVKFCGVPPKAPKFLRGICHMFCLTNFPRRI